MKKLRRERGRGQRYYIGDPKTEESNRHVVVPRYVLNALEGKASTGCQTCPGTAQLPSDLATCLPALAANTCHCRQHLQAWRRAVRSVEGLPYIHFEHARHTFGSAAHALGADIATISQAMGHSSIETTKDIYVSVGLEQQRELARTYDKLMGVVNG